MYLRFNWVVGTMFTLMGEYAETWAAVNGSAPAPTVGPAIDVEPEPVPITLGAAYEQEKPYLLELWYNK